MGRILRQIKEQSDSSFFNWQKEQAAKAQNWGGQLLGGALGLGAFAATGGLSTLASAPLQTIGGAASAASTGARTATSLGEGKPIDALVNLASGFGSTSDFMTAAKKVADAKAQEDILRLFEGGTVGGFSPAKQALTSTIQPSPTEPSTFESLSLQSRQPATSLGTVAPVRIEDLPEDQKLSLMRKAGLETEWRSKIKEKLFPKDLAVDPKKYNVGEKVEIGSKMYELGINPSTGEKKFIEIKPEKTKKPSTTSEGAAWRLKQAQTKADEDRFVAFAVSNFGNKDFSNLEEIYEQVNGYAKASPSAKNRIKAEARKWIMEQEIAKGLSGSKKK